MLRQIDGRHTFWNLMELPFWKVSLKDIEGKRFPDRKSEALEVNGIAYVVENSDKAE